MGTNLKELAGKVRDIARIGVVNIYRDRAILLEAADRLDYYEDLTDALEERLAILAADRTEPTAEQLRFPVGGESDTEKQSKD